MGVFSAIGGFLGLVDNNKTASALARDISSGIDMLVHTDEEKAIESAKQIGAWIDMVKAMKDSEQLRSVTRRILAIGTVFNIFCLIWLCVLAELVHATGLFELPTTTVDLVTFTQLTWAILKISAIFQLGWVFCTIIVFYFGPHLVQALRSGKA